MKNETMILPIYSTSKLVRITLAGIVVFFLIFAVSLLPAVLVLPTSKYEEISSFRPLVISNWTENRFSSAYSGGTGSSLSRRRALNLAWKRTSDANESDAWKRTESDFSSTASTTATDLATDSMENGGSTLAAFVDREYLTRVDVLVTVGRGEYQQNIVERFLDRSGGKQDNLHRICNNEPPIPDCYPDC